MQKRSTAGGDDGSRELCDAECAEQMWSWPNVTVPQMRVYWKNLKQHT